MAWERVFLAIGLLCSKTGGVGFFASLRTELEHDKSNVQTVMDPDASPEYPAVWLGKEPIATQSTACPADL